MLDHGVLIDTGFICRECLQDPFDLPIVLKPAAIQYAEIQIDMSVVRLLPSTNR